MATSLVRQARVPLRHMALVGWLPSALKVFLYRHFFGYRIGKHVRFALGSVVVGREVAIEDHVQIGLFAAIVGKRIKIGRHSSVGMMSFVSCRDIEIGEDARIREQVFVGGPQLPDSRFKLGSRTVVLQMTTINPTKPVIIGDDSGIGGHCLIFTHSSWLNVLDGYPVSFEPVTIGKSVWLPWRVFVMPGASIGDGSVIGANSLVLGSIPSHSLAVGSPARVIRQAPDFPRALTQEEREAKVEEILKAFDLYVLSNDVIVEAQTRSSVYTTKSGHFRLLRMRAADPGAPHAEPRDTVLVQVPVPAEVLASWRARGVEWLDLHANSRSSEGGPLTEELASFLGRYGIRLRRDPS